MGRMHPCELRTGSGMNVLTGHDAQTLDGFLGYMGESPYAQTPLRSPIGGMCTWRMQHGEPELRHGGRRMQTVRGEPGLRYAGEHGTGLMQTPSNANMLTPHHLSGGPPGCGCPNGLTGELHER